jgi:tetratricopeptide (TPR) repeat protein
VPTEDSLAAGRLQNLVGNIEYQLGQYDAALVAFDTALELIEPCGLDDEQERVDLWLNAHFGSFDVHLGRNEVERVSALIDNVRPLVEARGDAGSVSKLYSVLADQHLLERRYRVDAQIIEEYQRAVDVARTWVAASSTSGGEPVRRLRVAMSELGFALTFRGDLDEARQLLEQVLASGEREGSIGVQAQALVGLAITALRGDDVEVVRELAERARATWPPGYNRDYFFAVVALQAWVAWRDQQPKEARILATEALDLWGAYPRPWPHQWLALWPLTGAHLDSVEVQEAVSTARRLLEPSQALLPDDLEAAVQAACAAWDGAGPALACRLLAGAVQLARALGYA